MISYTQLVEALAGGQPAAVSLPPAQSGAAPPYGAAQPLPPAPAAPPEENDHTVTNLNLQSVDGEQPYDAEGEVEIGDAEIDAEE